MSKQSRPFRGFKTISLPLYTVVTPQTGDTFEIRYLTISEILQLRESLLTQNRFPQVVSQVLWDAICNTPDHIETYNDFIEKTTIKDREALIYGLLHSTYGDNKTYLLGCGNCESQQVVKINFDECFSAEVYYNKTTLDSYKLAKIENPSIEDKELDDTLEKVEAFKFENEPAVIAIVEKGMPVEIAKNDFKEFFDSLTEEDWSQLNHLFEYRKLHPKEKDKPKKKKKLEDGIKEKTPDIINILEKRIEVKVPISGLLIIIKQPTLKEEIDIMATLSRATSSQLELASDVLYIEKIEEYEQGKTSPVTIVDDRLDILKVYKDFHPTDRTTLLTRYQEEFGKYCIKLNATYKCDKCKFNNKMEFDILDEFFRLINTRGSEGEAELRNEGENI